MAMNYQNFASLGVNLNRQKYGPLDISNVFTSVADLKYYLTKGTFTEGVSEYWYKNANEKIVPYPYEGQVLATVIDGVVSVYALSLDAEGNFQTQEIGAKVEVDGKTIKLNADGKLELVGLPADIAGKTLVPSLVNGVLTWAEPDTSTAEGQAQEIEGLKTRATALEATVNGSGEGESRVPGLVEKVAALEAVDNATQAELDAYKEVVTAAIAAGVKEAKDYADAQDADTVYDDSAVTDRLDVIERDYLKIADKYDDTALSGRVAAIEGDYLKVADKYDDTALTARVKALEDEERYDDTYLQTRVGTLETASADHETRIGKVEDFFKTADGESLSEAMDTLIEIQKEIASDNEGAAAMLASIEANTTAITKLNGDATTDGSVDKKIADAIAPLATTEALNGVKETAEAAQTAQQVSDAIDAKIAAQDFSAYAKTADVVTNDEFTAFETTNTQAIATAKQEAIDAAAAAEEAKGYAVATDVASTYATKDELTAHEEEIENELLAYAKTADVKVELAKKVESATIAHAVAADPEKGIVAIPEGITKEGTTLKIVVDAPTRAETTQMIADKVAAVTGGESAAAVKLLVEAEAERSIAKDEAHDAAIAKLTGEATVAGSVAEAKALAQKGVDDAAQVASDLDAAELLIAGNTREIETVKGTITTVNETLSGKVTALENKDIEIAGLISGLDTTVSGHTTTITEHGVAIKALQDEDARLVTLIQGNTDKFAGYYTKGEVDAAVQGAIDAIPEVDFAPYLKSEDAAATYATIAALAGVSSDLASEIVRAKAAENKIADDLALLIENPTEDLDSVKELIEHVKTNGSAVAGIVTRLDGHDTAIETNAAAIAALDTTVKAIVQPKASEEVTVATDGTLGLGKVSTDKLELGEMTLVLNGGDASTKASV